jgi:hypothetical protein
MIIFPMKRRMRGGLVGVLQGAFENLFGRGLFGIEAEEEERLLVALREEHGEGIYGEATINMVQTFQRHCGLESHGEFDRQTAEALEHLLAEHEIQIAAPAAPEARPGAFAVAGTVLLADGSPGRGLFISAVDRDLRAEEPLGHALTDAKGGYRIHYYADQFARAEAGSADLVVRVRDRKGNVLAASPILFGAPVEARIDLIVEADKLAPPALFDAIAETLRVPLRDLPPAELEEEDGQRDLAFLSGESGIATPVLARFAFAHRMADGALPAEFWFAILTSPTFAYKPAKGLAEELPEVRAAMAQLTPAAARRKLTNALRRNEIAARCSEQVEAWLDAFAAFAAGAVLGTRAEPSFAAQALADAGISDPGKRRTVADLINRHGRLAPKAIEALEASKAFTADEVGALRASYDLADVTRGDFALVKALKNRFKVRQPEHLAYLARASPDELVEFLSQGRDKGRFALPLATPEIGRGLGISDADTYGRLLHARLTDAYPTAAFAGGLTRSLAGNGVAGLTHGKTLSAFFDRHPDFEIQRTPVDAYLADRAVPEFRKRAGTGFATELKAVQRVAKLAPGFDAADTLLADGLHSAQGIYRRGRAEFVSAYAARAGFTEQSAGRTWDRAADTHAAVVTIVGDLQALDGAVPAAVPNGSQALLEAFPNWNNLFRAGDLCACEECRSVLGPAAYFADLLMYLGNLHSLDAGVMVKDVLLKRRPDLGYIELNCNNALTPLPYVDVVCEVLESVVANGASDKRLTGFTTVPAAPAAARTAVLAQLTLAGIAPGAEATLSQIDTADPDRWVVHGEAATCLLLKKSGSVDFHARMLPNTKAGADELRAYPAYVDAKAYEILRGESYPRSLPFDLFAEEVRAGFEASGLKRWELMETLRGPAGPNTPGDSDIAAEYFRISCSPADPMDEKRLILQPQTSAAAQKALWGESVASWLPKVSNVRTFLLRAGLEYEAMLALLDLPFIRGGADLHVNHQDSSCDTDKKDIVGLDAVVLDRIHRFLRLWRKLPGWTMWELDLAIRAARIGGGTLDAGFLVNLFHFCRLKERLGKAASVEQVLALFGKLPAETHYTQSYHARRDGLYQALFLNKRLIRPLDAKFALADVDVPSPAAEQLATHMPVLVAALGTSEADLGILAGLPRPSDGQPYIDTGLTLTNLSYLWRQAWLAKLLKRKATDWQLVLKLLKTRIAALTDADPAKPFEFLNPKAARDFIDLVDQIGKSGFTPDELDWLLAGDTAAKAATREADAARTLLALRKDLQAIRATYDPARYPALTPATDVASLSDLLAGLLQQLGRDDAGAKFFIDTLSDQSIVSRAVAGLPGSFTEFPAAISGAMRISYNPATKTISFAGLMTAAQKTQLLSDASLSTVTGVAAYQQAIAELHDRPRLALRFFEPIFSAPLASLPPEVDFGSLADPLLARSISYDAENAQLVTTGILAPSGKAALDMLSADPAYRNAINSLFAQPTGPVPADRLWLEDADLLVPLPENLPANLAKAINKALPYLSATHSRDTIVSQTSAKLGLTEAMTTQLLTRYPVLPPIAPSVTPATVMDHLAGPFAQAIGAVDAASLPDIFHGWYWMQRAAMLLKQWKLALPEWKRLTAITPAAGLLDLATLPLMPSDAASVEATLRTARIMRMRDSLPETGTTLFEVMEALGGGATAAHFAAAVAQLDETWRAAHMEALIGILNLAYPGDYLLAENWERLRRAFYFLDALNAGPVTAAAFAGVTMDEDNAKALKNLLRGKFGSESWLTLSAEIQDRLRERKRDALTSYLLTRPAPTDAPTTKWDNSNDLYAYYLLDVEMCACQLTSRLVQGSGSIQLFVQRCLMGLEPKVKVEAAGATADSAWNWWTWMSKYRVWQANRQVFLWPENWIAPELKKDRSPFFRDLETEMQQNEVTTDSATTAFANYLEKLDGVAQLEIAGFFQEENGADAVIHVFGRTRGAEPHLYYYRRYDYRQWSPWEKVEAEIQGDYLVPAVLAGKLFLFWPIFTEVPDETSNSTINTPSANESGVKIQKTAKRLRVQLAVSDYHNGKWSPKRISKDYADSSAFTAEVVRSEYRFVAVDRSQIDGRFGVRCSGQSVDASGEGHASLLAIFEIGGCKGVAELADDLQGTFTPTLRAEANSTGGITTFMRWTELQRSARKDAPDRDFSLELVNGALSGPNPIEVLHDTLWPFQMTPAWHFSYLDQLSLDGSSVFMLSDFEPSGTWLPYFYNDRKRSFFVRPALWGGVSHAGETATNIWHYYPDIRQFIVAQLDFAAKLIREQVDKFDFSIFTEAEMAELQQFLFEQFTAEHAPPYSLDEVRNLATRYIMRYVHALLGLESTFLFLLRQFDFANFYHPFVCDFTRIVSNPLKGIPGLMQRDVQLKGTGADGFDFKRIYQPTFWVVDPTTTAHYPREIVDFAPDGAYASYNWELFFHAPLLIANALSANQRFEEARDWYHFMFNPLGVESSAPNASPMSKYWITKPFFETSENDYTMQRIENILALLAGDPDAPGYSIAAKEALDKQVYDWRTNPFEPHRIANYRTVAYQKTVLMRYLDNLIAWGDNLFEQDSMESINQATQLYVMAAELLGPRPRKIPPQAKPPEEGFYELQKHIDSFANALVEVENLVPAMSGGGGGSASAPLPMLYFCIPYNSKMVEYWDRVADRLYKIRHCMNIEGVVRALALFEPPIDPGALVKAVAGGADLASALADLNAPLPLYRFNVLLQKANEVCADVKALGGALMAALEKKDGEALALLRQSHEMRMLDAVKAVRQRQVDEARDNLEAVKRGQKVTETKRDYYRDIERIISQEQLYLDKMSASHTKREVAQGIKLGASIISLLPAIDLGASGFGGSPLIKFKLGGLELGQAASLAADVLTFLSEIDSNDATMASVTGGYERRWNDWKFQEKMAERELDQIASQIAAAEVRLAVAEKEFDNQSLQIENAKAIDQFMRSKYTSQELYQWQLTQISGIYFSSYKLAYDLARRAERCFRFELGLQDSSFISFGYWDNLRKGLLSGEKLQYDLRRLETAYVEKNHRELELTKHVSLALHDPLALARLIETGRCFFDVPEEIFDLDYPGHYMRRIKSVGLTLPCVAGPYTTIACTLRLVRNSVRVSTAAGEQYGRNADEHGPGDDPRFVENLVPVSAIATSSGQNDTGLFELNFRDERYLPFEGAGAISNWLLELFTDLPANNPDGGDPDYGAPLRQFDYRTVSDAILHIKYTARQDAGVFKNKAITHLREYLTQDGGGPRYRAFNLRRDFPAQWERFLNPADPAADNVFEFEISSNLFRTLDAGQTLKPNAITLIARGTDGGAYSAILSPPLIAGADTMQLPADKAYGGLHRGVLPANPGDDLGVTIVPHDPPAVWKITVERPGGGILEIDPVSGAKEIGDLWLILSYERV